MVEVDEGAGWVRWAPRQPCDIAPDGPGSPAEYQPARRRRPARPRVVFGDGRVPPVGTNNIRARYRVGGGARGNVAASTITEAVTAIPGSPR